ncbi:MAG: hypothetical protein KKC66_03905 [Candidatus Omnitrophica bacterium]|nr:hypothetical protein [Candidatus Omnitrophota bacterium]
MKMRFPVFPNPDDYSENEKSYCNGDKSADKHLINSFGIYKKRNNYTGYERYINGNFSGERKFKEETAGKGSSNAYLYCVHKSFCQELSSTTPHVHTESLSRTTNEVKADYRALQACKKFERNQPPCVSNIV